MGLTAVQLSSLWISEIWKDGSLRADLWLMNLTGISLSMIQSVLIMVTSTNLAAHTGVERAGLSQ